MLNAANTSGSAATRHTTAKSRNAERQPDASIMALVAGERITPPTPDPDSAMDTARPRFKVNQLEMTTDTRRRVPATTTIPATTHSA